MNISVDWTLGLQILNFIVLIVVLNSVLYKPIRGILAKRKATVEGLEGDIARLSTEAADCETAIAAGIKDARTRGLKEKNARIDTASAEEQAMIAEIQASVQTELADFRQRIAVEADGVRKELDKQVDAFASAIGTKILGRSV